MKVRKPLLYYILYPICRLQYMNTKVIYEEEVNEPSIFISNHARADGPIMTHFFLKRNKTNWIINCSIDEKCVVNYAYHDILCGDMRKNKKKTLKKAIWISKRLPKIIKASANLIPVYHDQRIKYTLNKSIEELENGRDIIIFAESPNDYSKYITNLQTGFVTLGNMYYKKTGKCLKFYPTYVSKKRKRILVGKPIKYDPLISINQNREIINRFMTENITRLALSLKPHKPITFLPEEWYIAYDRYRNDLYGYWKMIEDNIRK